MTLQDAKNLWVFSPRQKLLNFPANFWQNSIHEGAFLFILKIFYSIKALEAEIYCNLCVYTIGMNFIFVNFIDV